MNRASLGFLCLAAMAASQPLRSEPAPPVVWAIDSPYCLRNDPALGLDGRFYVTAATECDGWGAGLSAFDPADGSLIWGPVIPTGCAREFGKTGVSVGENGLVYATGDWNECGYGRLSAFQSSDGALVWDHHDCPIGGNQSPHPRQTPAIDDFLGSVYFGTEYLCSANMESGAAIWARHGGHFIGDRGLAIDAQDNVFYGTTGGNFGGRIRSYSSEGVAGWQKEVSDNELRVLAVISGDVLLGYHGAMNRLLAWNGGDGAELWHADGLTRPVADADGNLYASGVTGTDVVSLDADGDERWRRILPDAPWAKVDFVDATGRVYARGGDRLFALNASDGQIAWSFEAEAEIHTAAVLTPEGDLFFTDLSPRFYRLDTALAYSQSAWPIALYGDRRHTQKVGEADQGMSFFTLSPCRVLDTRPAAALQSGIGRTFQVAGTCGIPTSAKAVAMNVSVVGATGAGYVTLYPGDLSAQLVSNVNFAAGLVRSNNAILGLATNATGSVGARASIAGGGQVHLILDVSGYFE